MLLIYRPSSDIRFMKSFSNKCGYSCLWLSKCKYAHVCLSQIVSPQTSGQTEDPEGNQCSDFGKSYQVCGTLLGLQLLIRLMACQFLNPNHSFLIALLLKQQYFETQSQVIWIQKESKTLGILGANFRFTMPLFVNSAMGRDTEMERNTHYFRQHNRLS